MASDKALEAEDGYYKQNGAQTNRSPGDRACVASKKKRKTTRLAWQKAGAGPSGSFYIRWS